MYYVHKSRIGRIQFVVFGRRYVHRHRRIQARNAGQNERPHLEGHEIRHMGAERETDYVNVIGAALQNAPHQLTDADATVTRIVHGAHVARCRSKETPVDVEQIVFTAFQVF